MVRPSASVAVDAAAANPSSSAGVSSLLPSASPMMLPFVVKAEKPDEENGTVGGDAVCGK